MERSRVTIITLICVLISSISGIVVETRVKPGDDVTIYCDCTRQNRLKIAWLRNCTHKHQPLLMILSEDMKPSALPRYSLERNDFNKTFDLLVKNITESDLGLYYCALYEKTFTRYKNGVTCSNDVLHYGNRATFLSLLDVTVPSADPPQTTLTPVNSICWTLLVSVCPVGAVLSSLLSSICVYCICHKRTKAEKRNMRMRKHNEVVDNHVCYASLDIKSSGQKRLKKRAAESFDLCIYSEVKAEKA
ncbi:hypothetical protein AOLI_G00198530 [Acnodon oligacanthus]